MKNLLEGLEEILLMGPGPSLVPPQVYKALSRKTIGHLDPYFLEIMEDLKGMLRKILNTNNTITPPALSRAPDGFCGDARRPCPFLPAGSDTEPRKGHRAC